MFGVRPPTGCTISRGVTNANHLAIVAFCPELKIFWSTLFSISNPDQRRRSSTHISHIDHGSRRISLSFPSAQRHSPTNQIVSTFSMYHHLSSSHTHLNLHWIELELSSTFRSSCPGIWKFLLLADQLLKLHYCCACSATSNLVAAFPFGRFFFLCASAIASFFEFRFCGKFVDESIKHPLRFFQVPYRFSLKWVLDFCNGIFIVCSCSSFPSSPWLIQQEPTQTWIWDCTTQYVSGSYKTCL